MVERVLQDILTALPLIGAEDARLDKEHGIADPEVVNFASQKDLARAIATNQPKADLKQKLNARDSESLLKAEALMYYGRGDFPRFADALQFFRQKHETADEIVRTILEKLPALSGYIDSARRKLEAEGLTTDTI